MKCKMKNRNVDSPCKGCSFSKCRHSDIVDDVIDIASSYAIGSVIDNLFVSNDSGGSSSSNNYSSNDSSSSGSVDFGGGDFGGGGSGDSW